MYIMNQARLKWTYTLVKDRMFVTFYKRMPLLEQPNNNNKLSTDYREICNWIVPFIHASNINLQLHDNKQFLPWFSKVTNLHWNHHPLYAFGDLCTLMSPMVGSLIIAYKFSATSARGLCNKHVLGRKILTGTFVSADKDFWCHRRYDYVLYTLHTWAHTNTYAHTSNYKQTFLFPLWILQSFLGKEDSKEIVRALHPRKFYLAS